MRHHLLKSAFGHGVLSRVPREYVCAGHVAACVHWFPAFLFLLFLCCLLEQAEQARHDVRDIRRKAGRREVEPEYDAHRSVPYPHARVPDQDEYCRAHQQRCRDRYRQSHHLLSLLITEAVTCLLSGAEAAVRLAAQPAGTEPALLAHSGHLAGKGAAGAHPAIPASVQLASYAHHLPSALVSFP